MQGKGDEIGVVALTYPLEIREKTSAETRPAGVGCQQWGGPPRRPYDFLLRPTIAWIRRRRAFNRMNPVASDWR